MENLEEWTIVVSERIGCGHYSSNSSSSHSSQAILLRPSSADSSIGQCIVHFDA